MFYITKCFNLTNNFTFGSFLYPTEIRTHMLFLSILARLCLSLYEGPRYAMLISFLVSRSIYFPPSYIYFFSLSSYSIRCDVRGQDPVLGCFFFKTFFYSFSICNGLVVCMRSAYQRVCFFRSFSITTFLPFSSGTLPVVFAFHFHFRSFIR